MPKTTAKPSTLPISGKVTAKSPYGIQIDVMPEVWLNWSKEEYRKEPWEADDVQKGDWVNLEVSGNYIKSIALTEPPTREPMVSDALGGGDKVAPEDPFEGMEGFSAGRPRNPIATERERSIQRQVALKAAVELALGMAGPPPAGQVAGSLNAAFVVDIYRTFRAALEEE